ncbi:hypothetical protein [Streptomyces sp. NPDC047981]|uniref:hypothetical protein n=1 Tax=Streptomyces sp. NPDC047981 TaxID=3154610 RepID=UPI00341F7C8D
MRTWRWRSIAPDRTIGGPYGDPLQDFINRGWPPGYSQNLVALLQGEVVERIRALVPGVEDGRAAEWLWVAAHVPARRAVEFTARSDVPEQHAHAAGLTGDLLTAVATGLRVRRSQSASAPFRVLMTPATVPCSPSLELASFLAEVEAVVDHYFDSVRAEGGAEAVAGGTVTAMRDQFTILGKPCEEDWGGWALLATMMAFEEYADALPQPGRPRWRMPHKRRRAEWAGRAHQAGRMFTAAAALGLLRFADEAL